jgi:hypothetical protein
VEAIGPVLVVLSIPLMFRWVPRNRLYGFRVAATLRDDGIWYEINARSARHLCLLGLAMIALELALPLSARNTTLTAIAISGLVLITIVNWREANRLSRRLGV